MNKKIKIETLQITDTLKAITIHGPWAWAIVNGYKSVENRIWLTPHRGLLAIQAGRSSDSDERARVSFRKLKIDSPATFPRGEIVGTVELLEILPLEEYLEKYGEDPWNREMAIGPFCWVLGNPKPCVPIKCPGNFQIWNVKNQLKRFK